MQISLLPAVRGVVTRRHWTACAAAAAFTLAALPAVAKADTVGTQFEPSGFHAGDINGQGGWTKTGAYDAAIVTNSGTTASVFGSQSLRISNATTSGSFGDQTFSPAVVDGAGEATSSDGGQSGGQRRPHFDATFSFLSATPGAEQPGLALTVSPDSGAGGRMSFIRLRDTPTGVSIDFDDVPSATTDAQGHVDFHEVEIAHSLDRSVPHSVRFSIAFVPGDNNDIVKVYVDGALAITGTTWENYYRHDVESGPANTVPVIDQLLVRASSTPAPATQGKGFLFDNVSLRSSDDPAATTSVGGSAGGSVNATLSLTVGTAASFGAFTPGSAGDYAASTTANVISTAGDALLSVADPSSTATGHLVNGSFSLPSKLQAKASSPGGTGAGFADVGGTAAPTPLLTYASPITSDPVTLAFHQHVGATDALRTGSYTKSLTFTLSTTTP
jgi:hypothetical protein